ncbi:hypothetical protein PS9374_02735 [Planomonospora sphaerica]|uniref:Uncharacterized protein n=1 Tax=Planomonospora sphaerica TaxID=161355 RepID=A0A171CQV9_9ACTN|nr:hypothetical protein PS9374_02735 [Planomonospora sphaerica]
MRRPLPEGLREVLRRVSRRLRPAREDTGAGGEVFQRSVA